MRKASRLLLIAIGLGSAGVLSGCVVATSQTSQQLQTIGAVKLTTTACFSQQAGCSDNGNSGAHGTAGFQVLLGYRIPTDTSAPQAFATTAGQPLSFNRDSSYSDELQRLAPAAAGQKWVGYRSAGIAPGLSSPSFTVSPTFALKQADSGAPFVGPFNYRVVTGARATPGNPNAAVDCGSNLAGSSASRTICVDSPPVSELGISLQQVTQDLGILGSGATNRAGRGETTPVPFKILYAGKGVAPTFSLRAATTVPDATAKAIPASLTPSGASSSRARAMLQIPADTPPGSYDVTLIATTPGGQARARTHELVVGHGKQGAGCASSKPTIAGTPGPDKLVGTRHRDVIAGYGGNDRILARGGRDLICAGGGDDRVKGGKGNDAIIGRGGDDVLWGGQGNDVMLGGRGDDRFKH